MKIQITLFLLFLQCVAFAQTNLWKKGDLLMEAGSYEAAYDYFEVLSDSLYAAEAKEAYTLTHLKMVNCLIQTTNLLAAEQLAENTFEYAKKELPNNADLIAQSMGQFGKVLFFLRKNDESEKLLEAAAKLFENENASKAEVQDLLGQVYTDNGNSTLAIQYFESSMKIRRAVFGKSSIEVANSYNNLGRVYLRSEPLQALILFKKAATVYEKELGTNDEKTLLSKLNISYAYMEQESYQEALENLQEIQLIYELKYEPTSSKIAFVKSLIGRVENELNNYEKAVKLQHEALKIYLALYGEKNPEVANTYFILGEIHKKKEDPKTAVSYFQQAVFASVSDQFPTDLYDLPSIKNYQNADIFLRSLQALGTAFERLHFTLSLNTKDLTAAIKVYQLTEDLINQMRRKRLSEQDKLKLGQTASEIYERAIETAYLLSERSLQKEKYKEIAFSFCEKSKAAILLEAIADANAKSFSGIPNELLLEEDSLQANIATVEQQIAKAPSQAKLETLKAELFSIQSTYRNYIKRLEENYPEYHKLKYNESVASKDDIQQKLKSNEAMISYFVAEEYIFQFILTKKSITIEKVLMENNISKSITGFRNAIKFKIDPILKKTGGELYQLLIPNLPRFVTNLTFVPDGVLGTIPFEALFDSKSGEYLIEAFEIAYDYSATLFVARTEKEEFIDPKILLIAPVKFDQVSTAMSTLPETEKEVNEIKFLFRGTACTPETQVGRKATESLLKNIDLAPYKFLHFATHGVVDAKNPELSRLFLNPLDAEDGSLYSGEIYNLKINADLVTLSACETGLGKIAKGEGIVGLSRALQYAGANNLIVSLWQVSDASTSEMMVDFYEPIASSDISYSSALRSAKLALLSSDKYKAPFYWAPFILIGK